jgi:hypothetical protein
MKLLKSSIKSVGTLLLTDFLFLRDSQMAIPIFMKFVILVALTWFMVTKTFDGKSPMDF